MTTIDLTTYPRIESYYDNYYRICDGVQLDSLIKRGFLPGKLFVSLPEGVVFYWWAFGDEDMSKEIIPHGSSVIAPRKWREELEALGLEVKGTNRQPLTSRSTIVSMSC